MTTIEYFNESEALDAGIYVSEYVPHLNVMPVGRGRWRLVSGARYCIDIGDKWVMVVIDAGFVTDLDSVPRLPIVHAWFKGRTVTAAVLHDALYRCGADKDVADLAFLRAMKLERVKARYRLPIYWAVRLFGGARYEAASVKDAA